MNGGGCGWHISFQKKRKRIKGEYVAKEEGGRGLTVLDMLVQFPSIPLPLFPFAFSPSFLPPPLSDPLSYLFFF